MDFGCISTILSKRKRAFLCIYIVYEVGVVVTVTVSVSIVVVVTVSITVVGEEIDGRKRLKFNPQTQISQVQIG